jgi:organizing structure protein 2
MAFRPLLRQRTFVPAITTAIGATLVICSPRQLYAEEPASEDFHFDRKPIYDDDDEQPTQSPSTPLDTPSAPSREPRLYRPTPTDRLAVQISHARMSLYGQAVKAEDAVNSALTEALKLENSFTSTIRGLAPPKESNEKLLPGTLYVLVASMAGSIVTRNRNILLRASVPAAVGIGAAYALLPLTMKNVGDLVWTYEERFPALADSHLRTKARIQEVWETGKAHSASTAGMVQHKVEETRERLEDWVKKGK